MLGRDIDAERDRSKWGPRKDILTWRIDQVSEEFSRKSVFPIPSLATNEEITRRIADGVPFVVFAAKSLFDGNKFASPLLAEVMRTLREGLPKLRVTRLHSTADRVAVRSHHQLVGMCGDVAAGVPRILFVDDPRGAYDRFSTHALSDEISIEEALLSDVLTQIILPDAIILDEPSGLPARSSPDLPPLTPIEETLFNAMENAGLAPACQVSFPP